MAVLRARLKKDLLGIKAGTIAETLISGRFKFGDHLIVDYMPIIFKNQDVFELGHMYNGKFKPVQTDGLGHLALKRATTIKLFGIRIWDSFFQNGFGWFRLFGTGLYWKNTQTHNESFSERNGLNKCIRVGKWLIAFLPKSSAKLTIGK